MIRGLDEKIARQLTRQDLVGCIVLHFDNIGAMPAAKEYKNGISPILCGNNIRGYDITISAITFPCNKIPSFRK